MLQFIVSGIIGGVISSLIFPFTSYYSLRWFNSKRIEIKVDPNNPLSIMVINRSLSTIKNAIAHIQIHFEKSDIMSHNSVTTFTFHPSNKYMPLAWARNINDIFTPIIDIHQLETPDLSVMRLMGAYNQHLFIAAENGIDPLKTVRVILDSKKDYKFKIKLIAENILPVIKSFKYDHLTHAINEVK